MQGAVQDQFEVDAPIASGLAPSTGPVITTIDVSPRVNGHLARVKSPQCARLAGSS
jgi:hypothetical protein